MQKLSDMVESKVGDIANKQLQYFKIRDSEIEVIQRGLVQAVNGLSATIIQAYAQRSRAVTDTDGPAADHEQPYVPVSFPHSSPSAIPWSGQNFIYTDSTITVNIANDVNTRDSERRACTLTPPCLQTSRSMCLLKTLTATLISLWRSWRNG